MKEFKINFKETAFEELKSRIDNTRFPAFHQQNVWELGTPVDFLKDVLWEWSNYYEGWKEQENNLNRFPQFMCKIDGVDIHFFHIKSANPNAAPILMAHGWPDSFLRYSKTFPLLKDYHIIVPSIPGFGFGTLPAKGYVNNADTAEIWHTLMTEGLGYKKYVATGAIWGGACYFIWQLITRKRFQGCF